MSLTRLIPKQKRMSTTLGGMGGMLILLSETMFIFSLLNFLLITRLGMLFVYVFILPSKMAFSQQQAIKDDRSPTHNLLIEVNSEIKSLKKEIESLKQSLDKI